MDVITRLNKHCMDVSFLWVFSVRWCGSSTPVNFHRRRLSLSIEWVARLSDFTNKKTHIKFRIEILAKRLTSKIWLLVLMMSTSFSRLAENTEIIKI